MKRRILIAMLTMSAVAAAAWPVAARAQQSEQMRRIGVLSAGDPAMLLRLLREGLRELGYVEGRTIKIEVRSGPGKVELLRPLADELVRINVDVIVTRLTPAA